MREFNEFEKSILNRMAHNEHLQDRCLIELLFEFCDVYAIGWDKDFTKLQVAFNKQLEWGTVRNQIFDFIVLIQYLEHNHYIGVFSANLTNENFLYNKEKYKIEGDFPNIKFLEKQGEIKIEHGSGSLQINTPDGKPFNVYAVHRPTLVEEVSNVGKILYRLINSTYHPTQILVDFVDTGFKTKEDKRFRKTYQQTWWAIAVTAIIGILGILAPKCSCSHDKVSHASKIEKTVISSEKATIDNKKADTIIKK